MIRRVVAVVVCLAFTGCTFMFGKHQTTSGQRVATAAIDTAIAAGLAYAGSAQGSCASTYTFGDQTYTDPGDGRCLSQTAAGVLYMAAGLFALSALAGWATAPALTPPPSPPPQPWNPDSGPPGFSTRTPR